jgi:hypothetical protein
MGEDHERGALGEESTARALAALPGLDWRVFHDVHWPGRRYANIDHVVVGPGGLFVIDSKAWAGDIAVADGVLRQNGHRRGRHVRAATDAAMAVAELLPGLDPSAVKPVLCFDRDDPIFGWSHEVLVCSTANVATLLTSHPAVLDGPTCLATAESLAQSLKAATDPITPVPPKRQLAKKDQRARAVKRRRNLSRSVVSIIAFALLTFFVLEVWLPGLASTVEDRARKRIDPGLAFGQTATVAGNPLRPELQISVDRLRPTRALGANPDAQAGERPALQLMAARVTMRNLGQEAWTSGRGTTFALVDRSDLSHPRRTRTGKVTAGQELPALIKLKPGQARRGFIVFGLPRGVPAAAVRISVGPGYPKTVRWSAD